MLYEYKCKECGHSFEELKKVDERNEPCEAPCPKCEAENSVVIVIGSVINIWKCQRSTL